MKEERKGDHEEKVSGEEQSVRRGEEGVERKGGTSLPRKAGCVGSAPFKLPPPTLGPQEFLPLTVSVLFAMRHLELPHLFCALSVGQGRD